jgi:hypothetical protein
MRSHATAGLLGLLLALPVATACGDAASSTVNVATTIDNPFGLNAHSARDEFLDRFAQIGIGWYRVDAEWSQNEPAEGQLHWATTDRLVDTIKANGGFVNLVVAYTPSWASGSTNPAAPPLQPQKFVSYVRQVALRYRGRADCIGIWNEPNLQQFWAGTKTQYLNDILVPSLQAIKAAAPELTTCGPDLSSSGNEREDWMGPILAAAGSLLDVITHHQYDGSDTVSGRVLEIERMHQFLAARGHGNKQLWITEIGWDAPRFTRTRQAQFLRDTMAAMAARPWWNKTFWYDSHGIGWGLLDGEGGAPTPSFDAYRAVIANSPYNPDPPDPVPPPTGPSVLGPNEALQPGAQRVSADGRFVLAFQGDGNLVLYQGSTALWSTGTHGTGATVAVMQGDGNLVLYSSAGAPLWASNTAGNPGAWLVVQGDGNLVLYSSSGTALWASNTCCR